MVHAKLGYDHAAATKSLLENQRLGERISNTLLWVKARPWRPPGKLRDRDS
jgi:hypothetical protein